MVDAPHEPGVLAPRGQLNLQGTLFDDLPEAERPGAVPQDVGYRGPTACNVAGITYRQLDYWARTGLVEPTVREALGSGTSRLYSFRDILVLRVVKGLLDAGVSLPNIRTAIATLRERGVADLAEITLMSDGTTVYECTSTDEILDLVDFHTLNRGAAGEPPDAARAADIGVERIRLILGRLGGVLGASFLKLGGKSRDSHG